MALQARAEVTRQAIIEAAVDLFEEVGYGSTDLTAIINRAGVTKGAFYYHFPTKQSVAAAIIDEAKTRIAEATRSVMESPSPALDNLIRVTFVVAEMVDRDNLVWVGNQLRQAMGQISESGQKSYPERAPVYLAAVEKAVAEGDVRADIDPDEAAQTIWASMLGCRLLSDAGGEDISARLTQAWRVLLRAIVPEQSLPHFHEFVTRISQTYPQPSSGSGTCGPQ